MYRRLSIVIVVLVILASNLLPSAQAAPNATITVQSATDDGTVNAANCPGVSCRLRDAIAASASGDTINFGGDYTITLTVGALTIDKNLTIDGAGHAITISGNHAVRVFYVNSGYTFNLQTVTITQGNCGSFCSGGGLYNSAASTVNISNSIFAGNSAPNAGGSIYNDSGRVNVTNSTFSDNSALGGGGIFNWSGTLDVTTSTFNNNLTTVGGGGLYSQFGTLNVTNSIFLSNTVVVSNNNSDYGGGIKIDSGITTVQNSTFNGNSADWGGGLYAYSGATTVQNSTFSGNSANYGGGLFNESGVVTVTNSTLTGNSATSGSGVVSFPDMSFLVQNSIIAAQITGSDCLGLITSQGYNVESSNSCGFTNGVNGDIQLLLSGGSLNLQPLASNGTQPHPFTHALGAGSVAIDQIPIGVNGCVASISTDERGGQRANGAGHGGSACDIGAYEYDSNFTPNAITLRDLSATSYTSPGIIGAAGAAFVALSAFVIGRRRQRVSDGRKGEAFAK